MLGRRGPQYGEFARTTNPPNEARVYYYLQDKGNKVEILIQDLEGNEIQKLTGRGNKGLQQITWNLRKNAPPRQEGQRSSRSGREVDAGVYQIVFMVNGKGVQIKKLEVVDDPILKRKGIL